MKFAFLSIVLAWLSVGISAAALPSPTTPHSFVPLGDKILGFYCLLADDTTAYNSTRDWTPILHDYQQQGSNVLFLTFINPSDLPSVPPAFAKLALSRGQGEQGSVPSNTTVLFSIGGEAYSTKPNPWQFLQSKEAAEAMATEISKWPNLYGADGIDIDLETGAGAQPGAVANIPFFAAKLKELAPDFIITQPVFGSPSSVPAANMIIQASFNDSWAVSPSSKNSVSKVGIMVYTGEGSLQYVDNYANGCTKHCSEWYCPLAACVPLGDILLGSGGGSDPTTIASLAKDVVSSKLGGLMVWFSSVIDAATQKSALVYGAADDASDASHASAQSAWAEALKTMTTQSLISA